MSTHVRPIGLSQVLEDVIARRLAGDELSDEAVIAAHPQFMPELAEELRRLRLIRAAELRAQRTSCPTDSAGEPDPDSEDPAGAATSADPFPGYRVIRRLFQGGQGVVYLAIHKDSGRRVAVKVVRTGPLAGPRDRARFEREVQILRQLNHPRIVSVHESGETGGGIYYVMDYIAGQPLDVFMAARPLSIPQTLALFARNCEAVNAAHLRGVIHRDLKPGNIRIDLDNQPHILDFGLAKHAGLEPLGATAPPALSLTGQFIGSMPWASPEQASAEHGTIDVRTNVYSLGIILYHMLTGRFPYEVGGSLRDTLDNILSVAPPAPSRFRRRIDNELDTIVLKSLSKDRDRRYQTAGELGRDVVRYLRGAPIEAKRDSAAYLLRKMLQHYRIPVAAAAAGLVLITAAAVASTVLWRSAQRELRRAATAERLADQRLRESRAARDHARAQAHFALTEAGKSEQTLRFLQDILAAASPQAAGGRDVTVREALDAISGRVDSDATLAPEIRAVLHRTIGNTYRTLGVYAPAEQHLRLALDGRRKVRGADQADADVACTQCDLARALADRGALAEAEALYHEALATLAALLGDGSAEVARAQSGLAAVLDARGRYAAAEPLYRAALATQTTSSARYTRTSPKACAGSGASCTRAATRGRPSRCCNARSESSANCTVPPIR